MKTTNTIAAISSSMTPAGIGIVRVSGDEAIAIADKIYRGKKKLTDTETHTINYGFVYDGEEKIDQVLVMLMRAPRTFTGEDTVEFDCHGGTLVMQKILSLLIDAGAQQAEPGEFTKRAFLNGKMDLSQAEAVADIIEAENANALKVGVGQLDGRLSAEIKKLRAIILEEIAFIEAALDDPEHYDIDEHREELNNICKDVHAKVKRLIEGADAGRVISSGIQTAIIGKPNAGKSSIYNLLSGSESAIVTDIAGTTRDTLTQTIRLGGICLNITDTAGIRNADNEVEKIGVDRAKNAADEADLILCVIDGSKDLSEEDTEILRLAKDKKSIVLINKKDIGCKVNIPDSITFSAKTGEGKDELESRIKEMFLHGELNLNDEIYVTQIRHLQALKATEKSLALALSSIESGLPEDIISVDLNDAYESLGFIIGESVGEDVINEIFSKFCMGK